MSGSARQRSRDQSPAGPPALSPRLLTACAVLLHKRRRGGGGDSALLAEEPWTACMGMNYNRNIFLIPCFFPDGLNKSLNLSLVAFYK